MSKTTTSAFDPDRGEIPAEPGDDLVFVFSGFKLNMNFFYKDEKFDEDSARETLLSMSKEIWIDKTYVDFEGTKFGNVFLKKEGWE